MARKRGILVAEISDTNYYEVTSALVQDVNGQGYLICTEGVGKAITQEEYDRLSHTVTGQQIDLADFIRTFGSRLEDNYHFWYNRLTLGE